MKLIIENFAYMGLKSHAEIASPLKRTSCIRHGIHSVLCFTFGVNSRTSVTASKFSAPYICGNSPRKDLGAGASVGCAGGSH